VLTTIVSFFIILLVLVFVHEFGHFISAKLFKIKVEEFGFFMPPRIVSFKHGETIYSINALPIGGFVRLSGEEDPKAPGSLAGKSIPVRLIVLGAGSIMNLLLPFVLLSIAFMLPHQTIVNDIFKDNGEVVVTQISPDSPAANAGIKANDTILSVNGEQILNVGDYERLIEENLGKEITIAVKHIDTTMTEVILTPRSQPPEGEGETGVAITTVITKSYPFWKAIPMGAVRYWDILVLLKDGIVQSIKGEIPFEVAGPVGIAQTVGEVARTGMANLLVLTSLISINLGIVNIFPIPAFDGGRIVFVLLEWIRRGKRVSPKTEQLVHTIGFMILLALMLLITYRDIVRIISGGSLTS
jgi:regulator of sigma E protease